MECEKRARRKSCVYVQIPYVRDDDSDDGPEVLVPENYEEELYDKKVRYASEMLRIRRAIRSLKKDINEDTDYSTLTDEQKNFLGQFPDCSEVLESVEKFIHKITVKERELQVLKRREETMKVHLRAKLSSIESSLQN